jgi:hypothetical protein
MSAGQLQQWIDQLALVSAQRWAFAALAVASVAGALAATAVVGVDQVGFVPVLVVGLAVAAVVRPDSHTALFVETLVVWQWLAGTDDVTNPGIVVVAAGLFVFHTVIALMAVTPSSAVVARMLVVRWLRRCGYVLTATGAMWLVVAVMVDRRSPGNAWLSSLALLTLAAFAVAIRALSASAGERIRP